MIQEITSWIRNNASDEGLITGVTKASETEKERNLDEGKHHRKARVHDVSSTFNRTSEKKIGQAKMDNKVDNFGSGKVEKFLSAVDSLTKQDSFNYCRKSKMKKAGVSVKFLMVGETNSMVGYHLMMENHSIQLRSGGAMSPPLLSPPPPPLSRLGQRPDNNNNIDINNNIFGVSYKITIKFQPQVPYKVVPY